VKISNNTLATSVPSLQALANQELEIEATFVVAEALKKIQDALTTYNKLRQDTVKNKCQKNEDGTPKMLSEDQVLMTEEGLADIAKLGDLEVDLQFEQIPLSTFKGSKLKPADMSNLLWLVKK
jgi:hypothetical protein